MTKTRGPVLYIAMLLAAAAGVFSLELVYHLRGHPSPAVFAHSHLSQLAIVLFCFLFFIAERLELFHLSLRLCFLSLFLVWARILFELQTGRYSSNSVETGLLVFVGLVLLALTRHPVRMLEKKQLPS